MRQIALRVAAAVSLLTATALPTAAQVSTVLAPGTRLRLITPRPDASQQTVTIIWATSDSVAFRSEVSPIVRTISLSEVSAVEVRGYGQRPFLRNMMIGGAVGAAAGAIIASAAYEECERCWFPTTRSAEMTGGALLGGLAGIVGGMAIATVQRAEQWTRIPLNATVGIRPTADRRVALSLGRTF